MANFLVVRGSSQGSLMDSTRFELFSPAMFPTIELSDEWFRPAACYLVKVRNMSRKDVANMFGVERHKVENALDRFNETGKHKNRVGQGRRAIAHEH